MINNEINTRLEVSYLRYASRGGGILSKLGEFTDIYKYVLELIIYSIIYKQYKQPKVPNLWKTRSQI